MKKQSHVHIGKVVTTHGVKGELKIKLDAELLGLITSLNPLFFAIEKKYVPFFTTRLSLRENGEAIVGLEDITSKEEAQTFVKHLIFVEEKNIDRSYLDLNYNFLIGFEALNKEKVSIGIIDDIFNMPANKLARIMKDEKEILIPLHNDFIITINKTKKEIYLDLPDGLLDL